GQDILPRIISFPLGVWHAPARIQPKNSCSASSTSSSRSIARSAPRAEPYANGSRRLTSSLTTTTISSSLASDPVSVHRSALFPIAASAYVLSTAPVYPTREEFFPGRASKRISFAFLPQTCLSSRSFMLFSKSRPSRHVCLFHVAIVASLLSDRSRRGSGHVVDQKRPNETMQVLNQGKSV